MHKLFLTIIISILSSTLYAMEVQQEETNYQSLQRNNNGIISKKSPYSVKKTLDHLTAALDKKGISIALRWRHHEKAAQVDIPLRPTELLMFGNPALGSHLFASNQISGIDLPLKVLAWKDEHGQVWLSYNDPMYVADRHSIKNRIKILKKMSNALNVLSNAAIKPQK